LNIWQRKVEELVEWRGIGPGARTRKIYNLATAYLMQQYEKLDEELFNQFDGLGKIVWTTNRADIPCDNAIGCAEFWNGGGCYSMFYDNPRYDFFIMSMELAHKALGEFYVENHWTRPYARANNDVHYAANIMTEPWCWYYEQGFKILSDWLLFRKPTYVTLFMYDVRHIISQSDRIAEQVRHGTAPTGPNPYWSAMPESQAKSDMLDWLGNYDDHEH
jgi:hypothetical protein